MRALQKILIIACFGVIGFAAFNNFAPVEQLAEKAKADIKRITNEETPPLDQKKYVQIDGKLYEENERGIYYIDGVPTFVKKGKKAELPKPHKNPNLGPAIDPKIYKDAMGLDENDEFFRPNTGEDSD